MSTNPCAMVGRTLEGMATTGQRIVSYMCLSIGQAVSKVVAVSTMLVKRSDGAKNISLLAISVIEYAGLQGATITRFTDFVSVLKTFNDAVTARSIVGRLDEFTSGKAFGLQNGSWMPNIVKLAGKVSFLAYDVFGAIKFAEKVELVAKGTGNTLAFKMIGDTAEKARPFFGYAGCALLGIDSLITIRDRGFSWDSALSVLISGSRMAFFSSPRGSYVSVLSGGATAALCITRTLVGAANE